MYITAFFAEYKKTPGINGYFGQIRLFYEVWVDEILISNSLYICIYIVGWVDSMQTTKTALGSSYKFNHDEW